MASFVNRIVPDTIRGKLLAIFGIAVILPIIVAGVLMEREGKSALLHEKAQKLFGITRTLDLYLDDDLRALLSDAGGTSPDARQERFKLLNNRLSAFTDIVAAAHPGIGIGYYSKALDAIVTYGPSTQYGGAIGMSIAANHPGRAVMKTGQESIESGPQVRGSIMNAMHPIKHHNEIIGYIWANELSTDVERQTFAIDRAAIWVSGAGILLGTILAFALSRGLDRDIKSVTRGLASMRTDLSVKIPEPVGEIGEIAIEINGMARALLEARSVTERILHSIADGVVAVDRSSRVTSINPAAQKMLDVRAQDVTGRSSDPVFGENYIFSRLLLDALDAEEEHTDIPGEIVLQGRSLHVAVSSNVLRDSGDKTIGAVIVIKDLTEQSRLRTQIMRADRLAGLGELMAGVAHEIRNPLTSIRGFMQFLESCDDIEEWQKYAPLIIRQVDSLNAIIAELLEFGKPRPPAIQFIQINDLLGEVLLLACGKSSAQVVQDLSPDMPVIEGDGESLKQAFLNIIINALQAIERTGTIWISTCVQPNGVALIRFKDDGEGISEEDLEKIFDPFYSTKPNGTGLGLAMVHRIVDAHYGTVTITSKRGGGTEVSLRLPLLHHRTDELPST